MTRDTVHRLAAGIVTPAVAMLFFEIGSAVCSGDWRDPRVIQPFFHSQPAALAIAVLLGAPWSVPIAVLANPRNVWLSVPFAASAAALGIWLQFELLYRTIDGDRQAGMLGYVWIVPVAFGTVAALLFRFVEAFVSTRTMRKSESR